MSPEGTSIVYVRRRPEDGLDGIIDLAEQYYALGVVDFLIVDMSGDAAALAVLGKKGDPVRYLADASVSQVERLLQSELGLAGTARVMLVDDAPPAITHGAASNMQFVPRDRFALSTAAAD